MCSYVASASFGGPIPQCSSLNYLQCGAAPHPRPKPHNATPNEVTPFAGLIETKTPPATNQPPPPPLDTNTTALLQAAAAADTQVGAPETWSTQYLVETKVALHVKAQENPLAPKPLHTPLKLDTVEHTADDE